MAVSQREADLERENGELRDRIKELERTLEQFKPRVPAASEKPLLSIDGKKIG